jgi:hypothetical protein
VPITMAESEADWSTATTPKSPAGSVTVQGGDYIVVGGITADQTTALNTPSGGGLTYNLVDTINVGAFCYVAMWVAACPSTQTFTLSGSRSATSNLWGYNGLILTGSSGQGATAKGNATAAPSVSMTPQQANSAVAMFIGDWNAADGASRAYRTNAGTFTEQSYFRDSANYTIYGGAHLDAGTATSKAFGLTAPSMKYALMLVEMKAGTVPVSIVPVFARRMGALFQL